MSKENLSISPKYEIRYTSVDDAKYLRQWLSKPGMLHWFYLKNQEEIEDMIKVWMSFARYKCSLTAVYKGKPCGIGVLFLMPYIKVVHQAQVCMIVDPSYQRKGIGSSLVKNLGHLAAAYFSLEKIHYEIYGDNPMIKLLHKQGYHEVFRQKKFLKEDTHIYLDRVLMEKTLKNEED